MSYISIIVPAFHLNTLDKNEIINYCSSQFNISQDNFSLIEISNINNTKENNHYGVIFNESNLSLHKIEQLIYERNCIQNLSEKAFESLQLLSKKIIDLEKTINNIRESKNNNYNNNIYTKPIINSLNNGNNNIKDDEEKNENNNKIELSKKSIKKIKIEFKNMIDDIELLNTNKNKKYIQKDIILDKLKDEDKDSITNEDDILSK